MNEIPGWRRGFFEKHGESVQINGWHYFSDGALIECQNWGGGVAIEPPDDPYDRAKNILAFHQARLVRAIETFEYERNQLIGQAENAIRYAHLPPTDKQRAHLEELQKIVKDRQREFNAAQKRLVEATPPHKRKSQLVDAETRTLGESALRDIKAIRI